MTAPTLAEYAARNSVDIDLWKKIIAAAKNSDSDVIRYGAVDHSHLD